MSGSPRRAWLRARGARALFAQSERLPSACARRGTRQHGQSGGRPGPNRERRAHIMRPGSRRCPRDALHVPPTLALTDPAAQGAHPVCLPFSLCPTGEAAGGGQRDEYTASPCAPECRLFREGSRQTLQLRTRVAASIMRADAAPLGQHMCSLVRGMERPQGGGGGGSDGALARATARGKHPLWWWSGALASSLRPLAPSPKGQRERYGPLGPFVHGVSFS